MQLIRITELKCITHFVPALIEALFFNKKNLTYNIYCINLLPAHTIGIRGDEQG
jgi:hypothetical protein